MSSKEPSDLLKLEKGVPTKAENVRALREGHLLAEDDWLGQLQKLADQFPATYEDLEKRLTFQGFEPFELQA